MLKRLFLQLHVHSDRSHDSSTPIAEYVSYLHNLPFDYDLAVLGITDHNVLPIRMECALGYSTPRVVVVPGIQWRLHQTGRDRLRKRSTRRELLTLGNHDDLRQYILQRTRHRIAEGEEILGHLTEPQWLGYMAQNPDLMLVVPHPGHGAVDYYGPCEIQDLKDKMDLLGVSTPFFVEAKTGCDPFPRVLATYKNKYCVVGGSDAHDISTFLGARSMLSVTTVIPVVSHLVTSLDRILKDRDVACFEKWVKDVLWSLERANKDVAIKKHYGRSAAQLIGLVPRWVRRRVDDFPRNLLK
jgi:hypothetical protein